MNMPPRVTDRAFARIAEIAAMTGQAKSLRVAVEGGGCSGFQYDIKLDDPAADDLVLEQAGQKVLWLLRSRGPSGGRGRREPRPVGTAGCRFKFPLCRCRWRPCDDRGGCKRMGQR